MSLVFYLKDSLMLGMAFCRDAFGKSFLFSFSKPLMDPCDVVMTLSGFPKIPMLESETGEEHQR